MESLGNWGQYITAISCARHLSSEEAQELDDFISTVLYLVLFVSARFWVMFLFSELRLNMYLGYQSTFTKSDGEVSYRVNLQNIHDMLYAIDQYSNMCDNNVVFPS